MKVILKKLGKQLLSLLPTKLPVGVSEFESWADSFSEIYDLATQDRDSIHFILANEIIRLNPRDYFRKSKFYFYLLIQTAAAKQVAGYQFQQVKKRQAELQAKIEELQAKAAEQANENKI